MELITYRKTLDVHKGGVQFTLRGFETADRISRVIEISLMASGDTIDFPLERIVAMMYVTQPGADEPSINECAIVDNKIVYNVLPITEEGITKMKLKLIETGPEGARRVLATPTFEVEVINSGISDEGPGVDNTFDENHTGDKIKPEFTALENFIAKADAAYGSRLVSIEIDSDMVFKAHYADGTTYETTLFQDLFVQGEAGIAKSYAVGGTGLRTNEDNDNSKYYYNAAKSEADTAKNIMENSEEILSQVRQHGVYTAFRVDFSTGEVEYVSPRYTFDIDKTTGELVANEQTYTFIGEIERVVTDWLASKGIVLEDLKAISKEHTKQIEMLEAHRVKHQADISKLQSDLIGARAYFESERVTPVELGGTGAKTKEDAIINLGIDKYQVPWNVDENIRPLCTSSTEFVLNTADGDTGTIGLHRNSKKILMKNSGRIYIGFDLYFAIITGDAGLADVDIKYACFGIYVNEKLVKLYGIDFFEKYSEEDFWNGNYDKTAISCTAEDRGVISKHLVTLDVKKGDVVRLYASAASDADYAGYLSEGVRVGVRNINLFANSETPYTYVDLDDTFPIDLSDYTIDDLVEVPDVEFE